MPHKGQDLTPQGHPIRSGILITESSFMGLASICNSSPDLVNTSSNSDQHLEIFLLTHKQVIISYLNGSHLKVNGDLLLPNFLQCLHGNSNIIQVFNGAIQFLIEVFNNCKYVFHFTSVFLVTVTADDNHPGLRLSSQGELQVSYKTQVSMFSLKTLNQYEETQCNCSPIVNVLQPRAL